MTRKTSEIVEDVTIASGIGLSLMDIQRILSIVLLAFNIIWIITKIIIKLIKYYRNDGKIDKEEAEDILNDISTLNDEIGKDK